MALNDKSQGTRAHGGVSNSTKSTVPDNPTATDFVIIDDPTRTEGGAGSNFLSARDAKRAMRGVAGVVEARPGIIEDTHIDPLNEMTNEDDRWASATLDPSKSAAPMPKLSSTLDSATDAATGAVKEAYEAATAHVEGMEAIQGKTQ